MVSLNSYYFINVDRHIYRLEDKYVTVLSAIYLLLLLCLTDEIYCFVSYAYPYS